MVKTRVWWGLSASILTVLVLVVLAYLRVLSPVSDVVVYVFTPFTRPLYAVSNTLSRFLQDTPTKEVLAQTNACLQEKDALMVENAQLKQMLVLMQTREEEVSFLKEKYYGRPYRVAQIVSRDVFLGSTIWIDQGSAQGIAVGYPVLASAGVIVGKVTQVQEHNAKVSLLFDNESSVAAMLQNKNRTSGLVNGEHGVSLKMEYVPKNVEVKTGDVIVTSGIENYIPSGLVIGSVYEISDPSESLFKTLTVEPLADYDRLQIVVVLLPT